MSASKLDAEASGNERNPEYPQSRCSPGSERGPSHGGGIWALGVAPFGYSVGTQGVGREAWGTHGHQSIGDMMADQIPVPDGDADVKTTGRARLWRRPYAPKNSRDPSAEPIFQRIADRVSYGMGTPLNIAIWLVVVLGWTLLFALSSSKSIQGGTFLPKWFTSTGYNFPLNLVTTVAELYIGFLVGASSNRSERNLEATLARN